MVRDVVAMHSLMGSTQPSDAPIESKTTPDEDTAERSWVGRVGEKIAELRFASSCLLLPSRLEPRFQLRIHSNNNIVAKPTEPGHVSAKIRILVEYFSLYFLPLYLIESPKNRGRPSNFISSWYSRNITGSHMAPF